MSVDEFRNHVDRQIDLYGMTQFSRGFERALNAIEELSDAAHNKGNQALAETLRWAVKEVMGENNDN
jgi:hypothetical protein